MPDRAAATAEVDRLYGLPLDEFTAERDRIVRQLRGDGRRDDAAEVAALRKPVLAAWVVNQLVRKRRKDVDRLVDAADAIRKGRPGGDERLRSSLESLTRGARQVLGADGKEQSDAVVRDVATTLRTGAAEAPDELLAGRLTQPLEPTGFEAMAGAVVPDRARRPNDARADRAGVDAARKALTTARDEARRLARDADALEREARRTRKEADEAEKRVAVAEQRLADARRA